MNTESIVDQQAFFHSDARGGLLHGVILMRRLAVGYRVDVFSCPLGENGLPRFQEGGYLCAGRSFTGLLQADIHFNDLVKNHPPQWALLSPERSPALTVSHLPPGTLQAHEFEYVFELTTAGLARKRLARYPDHRLITEFLARLSGRDPKEGWEVSSNVDFMPILVVLSLAGIGELRRNGAALTKGELRRIARTADVDPDLDALYRTFELRAPHWDFAAGIGGGVALVL